MCQDAEGARAGDMREMIDEGGIPIGGGREVFYCLSIIGQVEGHFVLENNQKSTKYDHILPLLCSLEENDRVDGILILINTLGGDVEAGLAMAEMIASLSKPTATIVLGGGHSIGVPLATSGKRSFIVPSATMTIHPVRTSGVVLGVPQAFDYLEKMQDRIIKFVVDHSHVDEGYFRKLLNRTDVLVNDIGSILNGYEATACGLIDEVGGIKEALAALRAMCREKATRSDEKN
ncbi:MAG: ATP-dependent Clp protease proteolytic subunit [Clostridia bacterium]|nr:ATP-dependent Clp protease proteolytic subunit [Clostridia bacterium]